MFVNGNRLAVLISLALSTSLSWAQAVVSSSEPADILVNLIKINTSNLASLTVADQGNVGGEDIASSAFLELFLRELDKMGPVLERRQLAIEALPPQQARDLARALLAERNPAWTVYAAVGDSYSSGVGAGSYGSSGSCYLSSKAYPQL